MKTLVSILIIFFSLNTLSQQLVYKPTNPNFGGDTFNYQQLLSSAEAQNSFEDSANQNEGSELDKFADNLNRQILGQLSRSMFGDKLNDGLTAGTYNFGSLLLEIFDSSEGLVINILDINTGEQTQIIVPN